MSMKYDPVLYDSDPRQFLRDEINFYVNFIKKYNIKTALELGVGTGRIFCKVLPLLNSTVGIDLSEEMLAICKNKCKSFNNYELYNTSFVGFNLNKTFDLVYLPFNTFQHLLSEEDQLKCLKSIRSHMNNESYFILDVMNGDSLVLDFDTWKEDYSGNLPSGNKVRREQKTVNYNNDTNVVHKIFKYTEFMNGDIIKVEEFDAYMKITPNNKLVELINHADLSVELIWTDYMFQSNNESKKRIYLLERNEV